MHLVSTFQWKMFQLPYMVAFELYDRHPYMEVEFHFLHGNSCTSMEIQMAYMEVMYTSIEEVKYYPFHGSEMLLRSFHGTSMDLLDSSVGGDVALEVELLVLSCHATLPNSAPLSSYRSGRTAAKALRHGSALQAIRDVATKVERKPQDYALYSLRIGGATALLLAAGRDISQIVIQGEGRWK